MDFVIPPFLCQEGDKVIDPEDNDTIRNVRPDTLIRIEKVGLSLTQKFHWIIGKNWVNEKKTKN